MRYLLALMILLVGHGCAPPKTMYEERVKVQADTQDLSELIWDYTIYLERDRRLFLKNSYVAAAENESFIRFEFTSQLILEMCQARDLLVDVTEGFLERLNQSPVAKELMPYPFDAHHLEIYIYLESFHGEYVDPFYVGWIALEKGMAYYYAFDLNNHRPFLHDQQIDEWHTRIEPYEKSRTYVLFERKALQHYGETHPKPESTLASERFRLLNKPEPGAFGSQTVLTDRDLDARRGQAPVYIPGPADNVPAQRTVRSAL